MIHELLKVSSKEEQMYGWMESGRLHENADVVKKIWLRNGEKKFKWLIMPSRSDFVQPKVVSYVETRVQKIGKLCFNDTNMTQQCQQ